MKNKLKVAFIVLGAFLIGGVATFFIINSIKSEKNDIEKYMATIVLDGMEINIPNKYMATQDEEVGLIYWDENNFDMNIDVVLGDYESEVRENMDALRAIMGAGLDVKIPYTEISIDGKSYVYMCYQDMGDTCIHAYTKADEGKVFEVIVFCYNMNILQPQSIKEIQKECEEFILIIDSVVASAKPTEEDNTPCGELYIGENAYEEFYSSLYMNISEEYLSSDYIEAADNSQQYQHCIGEGYYLVGAITEEDYYTLKMYKNYDKDISVKLYIEENKITGFGAEELIENGQNIWVNDDSTVNCIIIDGYEFFYYEYEEEEYYEDEVTTVYHFMAATDLEDGKIYRIAGSSCNKQTSVDEYIEFMNIY